MITQNCEWCGDIADCNNAGLCDYCESDPEANPLCECGACDECGGDDKWEAEH